MANAATTQTSNASDTTGSPIPLCYGYVWTTGKRHAYYETQNTGDEASDFWRAGSWLQGHGEWDGPIEMWINDVLAWRGDVASALPNFLSDPNIKWVKALDGGPPMCFNFHSGCDSIIGSGLSNPSSNGPDQGTDILWPIFPPAIDVLDFSRIAYYTVYRKQPIQNQTNTHQNDPTQWGDIAPIWLSRALRCRLFDDEGNQTGYAFTTNPAWHFVDVILRRKLFPDYSLDLTAGPDALTAAVRNRFDWGSIYTAAQYFDGFLANGRRRFEGNYCFSQQTSLQAVLEQILLVCRSYSSEYGGKISLKPDMPRSSVFTFSRPHILPGSWEASDQTLHKTAKRFIANFRDLLVPQCSVIQSITYAYGSNPVVTTQEPHPFNAGDFIAIGGSNTPYDRQWQVATVPAVINPGTSEEIDPTTFTLVTQGANFPASVGSGAGIGLLYSRFKERSPEFWHKTNMLARGMVGLGIPRQRNKVKQTLDFATTTWDQASRLATYERDRLLGLDQTPYVTPPCVKLRTAFFARDAFGHLAAAIQPGDHVTLDNTVNFQYAGEYEVLDPLGVYPPSAQAKSSGGGLTLTPDENSGEIEFSLGPYNPAVMYDTSDPAQGGWPSVPGSDPGNNTNFSSIPLANGGNFVFFTGQLPTGSQFQLPSTGYPAANMLAWASPAGANVSYHSATTVQLCSVSASRLLTLIYADDEEGNTWGGDVNYAALTWLSTDKTTTDSNGMTWLELTLLGGETIIFGQGVFADGATVQLPAGYTVAQSFAFAYLHDMPPNGGVMYLAGAWVDSSMVVHCKCQGHGGDVWTGNGAVLIFAWKNNMGTVTSQTLSGEAWLSFPLSDGSIFGVGCTKNLANGATLSLPSTAGDGSNLEPMVGPSDDFYTAPGGHAQGIGACYLDSSEVLHVTFNNGHGVTWGSAADIFATYSASSTPAAT